MKLPKKVLDAISLYYIGRDNQHKREWNAEEAFDRIVKIANQYGLTTLCVSDSIWFTKRLNNGKHLKVVVNEETFPDTIQTILD